MPTMDDQTKRVFAGASDWSKQIMTLSTGILTLTVTFSDRIFGDISGAERLLLTTAWALYVVSICDGILVLTALNNTPASGEQLVPADVHRARPAPWVQVLPFHFLLQIGWSGRLRRVGRGRACRF
jgi:hypothetical protein